MNPHRETAAEMIERERAEMRAAFRNQPRYEEARDAAGRLISRRLIQS